MLGTEKKCDGDSWAWFLWCFGCVISIILSHCLVSWLYTSLSIYTEEVSSARFMFAWMRLMPWLPVNYLSKWQWWRPSFLFIFCDTVHSIAPIYRVIGLLVYASRNLGLLLCISLFQVTHVWVQKLGRGCADIVWKLMGFCAVHVLRCLGLCLGIA